jgi:hypothetical protein
MPLRLITLHLAQRFLIEDETFIPQVSFRTCPAGYVQPKSRLYLLLKFTSSISFHCHQRYAAVKMSGSPSVTATLCS